MKEIMRNIYRLAYIAAREYSKDGYRLMNFELNEAQGEVWYSLIHDNGNVIDIYGRYSLRKIEILKNRKLNKEIKVSL